MERMKTGEGEGKEPKKKCGACQEDLVISAFSKKQWQLKSQRRCKDCIASDKPNCNASKQANHAGVDMQQMDIDVDGVVGK